MTGAAKPRTRIGKRIKDEGDKSKELYSLFRRSDTPTQIQPSFSASSSGGTNVGDVNFLPTGGGTMIGALSFFPKLLTIASGAIDISKDTSDYTSRVIVSNQGAATTDDLDTITGAAHAGQLLFLQGVATKTTTLTNAGNIETINGLDFNIVDDDIIILMFDTTDNKWQQVTTGKQGVLTAGTFISASLSADQTANITATSHIEFDTTDSGTIVLQTGVGQADGIFELKSGKTYVLNASLRPEFSGATGSLVVAWYDITNTAELGKRAIYEPVTQTSDDANQPSASYILTPASDITVELRIISVTALTALANEYSHVIMFEVGAGTGGGGGGSISYPITPTINDHGSIGGGTEDLDLSLSTGHVHKMTLTADETLTFSNPPASGTQMEFEIEVIQDGTGGWTLTMPATVVETVSISQTASSTTILTCRTNDGGTNYHVIPALRGSITLAGGSVYATKALDNLASPTLNTDLDFNSFDAKNVDRLELAISSGAVSATGTPTIYLDASGDMKFNVATGDGFIFTVNDSATIPFSASASSVTVLGVIFDTNNADYNGVNIIGTGAVLADVAAAVDIGSSAKYYDRANIRGIQFRGNDLTAPNSSSVNQIKTTATSMAFNLDNTIHNYIWYHNGVSTMSLGDTALTVPTNIILGDGTSGQGALTLADSTSYVGASNGAIYREGIDVKVFTGGAEVNLSSITGATIELDNLGTTAINASMVPNGDGTLDLGSSIAAWDSVNADYIRFRNDVTAPSSGQTHKISTSSTAMDFNVSDNADTFNFYINGTNEVILGSTCTFNGNIILGDGATGSGTITFSDSVSFVGASNGAIYREGSDVKIYTGGSEINMSSIPTLSASNTWTGTETVFSNNVTFGSSGVDTISYVGKIDTNVLLVGGLVFKSQNTTEIGFQVTNGSLTVGAEGSIELPFATSAPGTKTAADTAFGNLPGCAGISDTGSGSVFLYVRQTSGNWAAVALTRDTLV
jgi:hypothetical protein